MAARAHTLNATSSVSTPNTKLASSDSTPPSAQRLVLQSEGLVLLAAGAAGFWMLGGAWVWFAVFFLVPDLFMLGYVFNKHVGAAAYNVAHTLLLPGVLAVLWALTGEAEIGRVAAIWAAHIGFDRLLGYGLKYGTGFKDTHLGRV